jgi:hypothetical protein
LVSWFADKEALVEKGFFNEEKGDMRIIDSGQFFVFVSLFILVGFRSCRGLLMDRPRRQCLAVPK